MSRLLLLLALACVGTASRAPAQEDFLSDGEISAVRDAQEPDKRMVLYMDFAARRIEGIKQQLAAPKSASGRIIQKTLSEYVQIMEALSDTIADARERRAPLQKGLADIEARGNLCLNYLRSIDSEAIPAWKDYRYTLEEAMEMTREEIAEAAKGDYPEVKERQPPTELPPPSASPPRREPAPGDEEGPPRKSPPSR